VELDRTLEEVTAKIGAAKKSFAQLKEELEQRAKSFDAELVSTWLARIGKLDDLEEQVARLKLPAELSSTQQGILSEISSTATELAALYGAFSATLPPTVDMPLLQAQMQLLKAEETHLKTLGLIAAKRDADLADMQNILQLARNQFQKGLTEQQRSRDVATTVQLLIDEARAAREEFLKTKTDENEARLERSESDLRIVLSLLLNVSALAARGDTPARLALLRQAEEARRHSIRVSAIATGSYEQILVNGAARLALYYQGGLQPETLARLLNALATFGLIPAVLVN
jgi:hypothetical protein